MYIEKFANWVDGSSFVLLFSSSLFPLVEGLKGGSHVSSILASSVQKP